MFGSLKAMFGGGDEAVQEALQNGASIIDVRSPMEYSGGHVAGSKNIPLNELQSKMNSVPKSKPVVFICASGARSGSATDFAKNQGYTAYNGGPWTRVNKILADIKG